MTQPQPSLHKSSRRLIRMLGLRPRLLPLSSLYQRSHRKVLCHSSVAWKNQEPGYGIFSCSGSPAAVEALSLSGLQWVCIDMQHGSLSYQDLSNLIRVARIGGAASIVRVGGPDDRFGIQQALDQGADGVMVPLVNTSDEAKRAVSYCLFPPLGVRSAVYPSPAVMRTAGPSEPPSSKLLSRYVQEANKRVKIWLQIETKEAMTNLDEILAVANVDCLFLGPADLALSHGLIQKYGGLSEALASDEMEGIVNSLLEKCHGHHQRVKAGSFAFGKEKARELREKGFDEIGFDVDTSILSAYSSQALQYIKS